VLGNFGMLAGFKHPVDVSITQPTTEQAVALKLSRALDETALRAVFTEARTANGFLPAPVPREALAAIVELAELGPTSANALPMRLVFVESPEAKERLRPAMSPGNLDKTMAAPVTAIVACDTKFYENFPRTFPQRPEMKDRFASPESATMAGQFAWDNAILQCAYVIIAARSHGLDAGPMGGFDRAVVDKEFFPDARFKSIYLINLGYGDDSKTFPRLPRLPVEEIATFL
jgi:3-hydroxypropanoate dehydrogenase